MARMRSRVSAQISLLLFNARETVWGDTPVSRATSLMVTRLLMVA